MSEYRHTGRTGRPGKSNNSLGTGSDSNPGGLVSKEVEEKAVTTPQSTQQSMTVQSTQQSIKISGADRIKPNKRPRTELYLGVLIEPTKTDYNSKICQVRDMWGTKCIRKADFIFRPLTSRTQKLRNVPMCNYHHYQIRKHDEKEETAKPPTFTKASNLI